MRKDSKINDKASKSFWDKEKASLEVRRKSLEPDDYILPSLDLSIQKHQEFFDGLGKSDLMRQQTYLLGLVTRPMVNFSHLSNTDLRLQYGAAALKEIEDYEDNYNNYIKTLYTLAKELMDSGEKDLASIYMEEGLRINTDIRKHYILAAKYYDSIQSYHKINELINQAEQLHLLTKNALVEELKTYVHTP